LPAWPSVFNRKERFEPGKTFLNQTKTITIVAGPNLATMRVIASIFDFLCRE
jgi:hypothetical protein